MYFKGQKNVKISSEIKMNYFIIKILFYYICILNTQYMTPPMY